MTKKGPLGKAEEFYVEQHCDKKSSEEIAKELDRAISLIDRHAEHYREMRMKSGGQMGRQPGVTVMTKNASMMADEFRKNNVPTKSSRTTKFITTTRKVDRSNVDNQ
jgi:hypothetical protein